MKKVILCLLFLGSSTFIFADSPITSTNFYEVYLHHELVKEAQESGELSMAMAKFLSSKAKEDSIQLKVALINALSWDIDGKKNADVYWSFLEKKYGYRKLPTEKLSGDELLCLSYLKIMDDYNSAKEPLHLVSMALKKQPESYTYQMISALINAQNTFLNGVYPHGWCKVYQIVAKVEKDKNLVRDFKPEASEIIFDYINIYEEYCEGIEEAVRQPKATNKVTSSGKKSKTPATKTSKVKPTKKSNPDQ